LSVIINQSSSHLIIGWYYQTIVSIVLWVPFIWEQTTVSQSTKAWRIIRQPGMKQRWQVVAQCISCGYRLNQALRMSALNISIWDMQLVQQHFVDCLVWNCSCNWISYASHCCISLSDKHSLITRAIKLSVGCVISVYYCNMNYDLQVCWPYICYPCSALILSVGWQK